MNIVEEHLSPDRFLHLIVTRDDDGDFAIGFDGFGWHTHGDILSSLSGLLVNEAVRNLVDQITGDEKIIAISHVNGEVHDVWPTDDPKGEFQYRPAEESLEFRLWSGLVISVVAS